MTLAPRTLPPVAIPKPKISLQFLFRRGVWGEPAKNGKENFWFWFRRLFFIEALKVVIDFATKFNSNSFKTI